MSRSDLLLRARRAYERGRLFKAGRAVALVPPMLVVSLFGCVDRTVSAGIAAILATLAATLVWRGGAAGRGVVPGFMAGAASLAIPLLVCPACAASGLGAVLPFVVCALSGVVSGWIVVSFATREADDRAAFIVAGGAIAALAGSLGCIVAGVGGIAAMGAGLALTAPLAARGARSAG